jgi:hypothetical protein
MLTPPPRKVDLSLFAAADASRSRTDIEKERERILDDHSERVCAHALSAHARNAAQVRVEFFLSVLLLRVLCLNA